MQSLCYCGKSTWEYPIIGQINTDVNHMASRAESNKPGERLKPSYRAHFNTRYSLLEVGRLKYLKISLQAFPFSLSAVFRSFAFSLLTRFFRSSSREGNWRDLSLPDDCFPLSHITSPRAPC